MKLGVRLIITLLYHFLAVVVFAVDLWHVYTKGQTYSCFIVCGAI